MNRTYAGELQMNALRTLHPLCKSPGFRETFFEEHKFPEAVLTTYMKEAKFMFYSSIKPKEEDWV
jgi:hypothetical protein